MARTAALGGLLAVLAGGVASLIWSPGEGAVALVAGLGAAALQTTAVALVVPALVGPWSRFMTRWVAGTALRIGAVVLFGVAAVMAPERAPPLPAALGLLLVLVPLLFYEGRLVR